ncbi:MAG: hypothetical protein HPY90_07870 [Syntrophothermus sp.]|uniref:hypothetical protein n=1 Tax=Syntrophothermus sp. TaxID=2736299 RepID=UPI00257E1CF5|nr:hypothetical protein [Syntrophothermus sp.]NSW83178.1 hypothetical protein [Syntrophothermus sp.]
MVPRSFPIWQLNERGAGLGGGNHATRVKRFVAFLSDWGSWYFEVPVAPSRRGGDWSRPRHKVDAVCVLGAESQVLPPVKWADSSWTEDIGCEAFENEKVALVEVKTRPLSHNALGQLITYEEEFASNWGCEVDSCWVVCTEATDELIEIYNGEGISVVIMPWGSYDPGDWEFFEA